MALVLVASVLLATAEPGGATDDPTGTCVATDDKNDHSGFTFYYDADLDGIADGVVTGTNELEVPGEER